jgi:CRISPR-associated protein Cas2
MFERQSNYRIVWLQVCFDLPVATKTQRRQYTVFRKRLLKDGYVQLQYSVYLRYCGSYETADVHERRLKIWVPPEGHVWALRITDNQFSKSSHYWGKNKTPSDNLGPGAQLELF